MEFIYEDTQFPRNDSYKNANSQHKTAVLAIKWQIIAADLHKRKSLKSTTGSHLLLISEEEEKQRPQSAKEVHSNNPLNLGTLTEIKISLSNDIVSTPSTANSSAEQLSFSPKEGAESWKFTPRGIPTTDINISNKNVREEEKGEKGKAKEYVVPKRKNAANFNILNLDSEDK